MQSGTIPESIANVFKGANSNILASVDLRLNFLSCCGIGPLIQDYFFWNVR
jgi:hypothetical protein